MKDGGTIGGTAGRIMRRAAACALAVVSLAAAAVAPPAGSAITNRATGTAQVGGVSQASASNTVTTTVGSGSSLGFGAALAPSTTNNSAPAATLFVSHTLTNSGPSTDTYTLAITDQNQGSWKYASLTLFADANGDGQPDSATPLSGPQTLAPGQVLRFVARLVIPANAPLKTANDALLSASAGSGTAIAPVIDRVLLPDNTVPRDCATVMKALSKDSGASPGGPVTVTLSYNACDKPRSKVTVFDRLPAGMRYVPNSGRWQLTGALVLTDGVVGSDRQGTAPSEIAYDWNVTTPGAVTATIYSLPAGAGGNFSFDVEIDSGLAKDTVIRNTAGAVFYDPSGAPGNQVGSETVTYTVTGRADFDLRGQQLPTAVPGSTVTFNNVLANRGDIADTYDISLAGSTFPAGTTFALFKSDGVTPLADTNGNGTPDTGVVPAGGSYTIIVKASIPATAAPGAYKIVKSARSALMPSHIVSADDGVDTLSLRCQVSLDPDNASQTGFGQHVTYTHFLTNRGNCEETLRAMLGYLADSRPGWTSASYVDNRVAGGGSLPGALDPTDTRILQGWTTTLKPGESLRILVDVLAPTEEAATAAANAKSGATQPKALTDSNVTTLVMTTNAGAALTVHDVTNVANKDTPEQPANSIRNFTDSSYIAPTLWGVIGGNLYLRADAAACNAVPDVIESRTVIVTGPNGEREQAIATETGANTGIFVVAPLRVRAPPVVAGNGSVEGRANDTFDIEILGCGRVISTVVTLMEPTSTVFDSRTNEPVAAATVTLLSASGGQCSATAVSLGASASNPVTTDANGRFAFPALPGGSYCLKVSAPNGYRFPSQVAWPSLPVGRNLSVTGLTTGGSYGSAFSVAAGGLLVIDLPVDAAAQDGLFVQKDVSRSVAEVGEFVDYTVRVRNGTGNKLDRADVVLVDELPLGFAFVAGSARREGAAIADPAGGKGPTLTLPIGHLDPSQQVVITYRVRLGPGAMQGDGTNRVRASYVANGVSTTSNTASAKVTVTGGVFTDKGFILGKVYLDCNANGLQDKGEAGVPGVRVVLEDGTYVVTDAGGKFSFYGITNRTHVLKADRTTLPAGARLESISARNLGDAGSRIVDMKSGEMQRADFAIEGCEAPVAEEVARRIAATKEGGELAALVGSQLQTENRIVTDTRALPASGTVQLNAATTLPGSTPGATGPFSAVAPASGSTRPSPAPRLEPRAPKAAEMKPLEEVVPEFDNKLAIFAPVDGETLAYAQTAVRVKGAAGASFKLSVNGNEVAAARVGKRAVLADKQLEAWEFIGIDLVAGENTLTVAQVDSFGNARGTHSIKVVAPGKLGKLLLELPPGGGVADGKTATKVVVRLVDDKGTPVTVRTPVTLSASLGKWQAEDLDPAAPGLQVMVEGGRGEFALLPPLEPASAQVVAEGGGFKSEARLDFLPELRSMIANGVIEGVVNMRRVNAKALQPARESDGFEQELKHLSREWNDGRTQAGVRAALYLKGKIKGEYLLTAAYDSDKDTNERLFRDIQPDEFYPIYGDSGVRGFDAQSTSRMYVRVDHRRSYLLWGDFTTQVAGETRKLSNYSRSLTGAKEHYENERMSVNAFASRDSTRQVIEEIRATGTSGPYVLGTAGALVNSEKVEIIVRDRNQPALIVSSTAQTRFSDYEIEALTHRILFKAPVASVDSNLNPVFVRVTYEVDQGGEQFWVAGIDAQVKLGDRVEVGGVYVKDKNPLAPFTLAGANMTVKLGEHTYVIGEAARTEHGVDDVKGDAGRLEIKHDSKDFKAQAFVAHTDRGFDNPGAYLTNGRSEAGGKLEYKLSPRTSVKAEALRTEDVTNGSVRDGLAVAIQHQLTERLTVELGVRHAAEKGIASPVPAIEGQPAPLHVPDEVTTVRARVTGSIPGVEGASVYGEAEVDVKDTDRKVIALGGEYQMKNKGRIYARHEFISSITGPYGLSQAERQNTTAVGVDTEYMKDGRMFSEYRIRDAMSGGDVEAALGLKNLWSIAPGLRLGTTVERVQAIAGTGQNENTAVALALEYTGSDVWKGSTRLEVRDGHTADSLLFTVGLAARLSRDWTALARNAYTINRDKASGGEHVVDRMQAGFAWRDNDTNRFNMLGRVEHRLESDNSQAGIDLKSSTTILSAHADYQPRRPFLVSGRYAAKWSQDKSNGLSTKYRAQVVGGRATWEFAPKWDVSLVTSALFGDSAASRQYGVGVEVGYLLATNLWVSAGYNFFGYKDADLAGADYTAKGAFVRMRYKFDENVFESGSDNKSPMKQAAVAGEKAQ